jgi:thioredoxin 1
MTIVQKALTFGRRVLMGALLFSGLLAGAAQAADRVQWSAAAFAAAQEAGKSIIVDVNASWRPICAKQKPTIAALEKDPKFADAVVFSVDFDTQKDALKQLGVGTQSTLIAFKGKTEKARWTGVTDPAHIRALFERAL